MDPTPQGTFGRWAQHRAWRQAWSEPEWSCWPGWKRSPTKPNGCPTAHLRATYGAWPRRRSSSPSTPPRWPGRWTCRSARRSRAHGLMLVPGISDPHSTMSLSWVTAKMDVPTRDGPPQVVTAAGHLSVTARQTAPAVRQVGTELGRSAPVPADPRQLALLAARRHVGAARGELCSALNNRIASQPAPVAAQWPIPPGRPHHPASQGRSSSSQTRASAHDGVRTPGGRGGLSSQSRRIDRCQRPARASGEAGHTA